MTRPDGRGLAWWWPVLPASALSMVGVGVLVRSDLLLDAGLAPLLTASAYAAVFGLFQARAQWSAPALSHDDTAPARIARVAAGFATYGSIAAMLQASLAPSTAALLLAGCAGLAYARGATLRHIDLLGGVSLGAFIAYAASVGPRAEPGWETLEPSFTGARAWLSTALAAGALIGWAPVYWRSAPPAAPGRSGVASIVIGASLLAALGLLWAWAALDQTTLRADVAPTALLSVVGGAAALIAFRGARAPADAWRRAAVCGALYLWLHLTDLHTLWWSTLAPGALGVAALATARVHRQAAAPWALAAGALLGATVWSAAGLPSDAVGGFIAAAPVVAAGWLAASPGASRWI